MRDFLLANWLTILIILVFVIYIGYLIIQGKWEKLRQLAYGLMMSAERLFADNQGKEKFDSVFTVIYNQIPPWLQRFIPPESIREKLQYWYELAKDYIKGGVNTDIIDPG